MTESPSQAAREERRRVPVFTQAEQRPNQTWKPHSQLIGKTFAVLSHSLSQRPGELFSLASDECCRAPLIAYG